MQLNQNNKTIEQLSSLDKLKIIEGTFNKRSTKALAHLNLLTISELKKTAKSQFLKTKNIGPKSTLQIAKKCEMTYGFTLFTLPRINTKVTIQLK